LHYSYKLQTCIYIFATYLVYTSYKSKGCFMIDIALLTALFIVGFNGSLHCVGMCGPIVGILGMNTETNSHGKKIGTAICYNLGRITTYMLLGVIAMILSIAMKDLKPLQIIVRYFAGIVMLF